MSEARCNLIIDSCCDLPTDLINVDGVTLLEFPYLMDEQEFSDDLFTTITPHEFYEKMRKGADCSTAQIPYLVLETAFKEALESGIPTVYIGFSSGLSGTFSTAELIADQLKDEYPHGELYVVDSKLASIAEGVLIFEAIRQRNKGLTAKEMVGWVNEAHNYVNEQFTLDSLEWLKKGGRIPASVAFAGSKLDVKPVLAISLDGTLSLTGVARGRKKSIRQLVDFYESHVDETGVGMHVIIGNADCPKDAEKLKEMLLKVDPTLLFLDAAIGPVIGSHVGPGMLAVAFMGKDAREEMSVSDRIAKKIRKN